jgi:ribosome-associated protein
MSALEDGKADSVVDIDLAGKTSFADHMVICSGQSHRQVLALADRMIDVLKEAGHKPMGIEGRDSADWVLVDLGDVIVHVFHAETRDLYNLEKMWSLPMPQPMEARA